MISLGTMTLLKHPGQLAGSKRDPGLAPNVAEELLRYLALVGADVAASFMRHDLIDEYRRALTSLGLRHVVEQNTGSVRRRPPARWTAHRGGPPA
jgi:hypothetical protein